MTLGPIVRKFAFPDAIIDIDNPDLYCAKCDKNYSSLYNFKSHLRKIHSFVFESKPSVNPDAAIDVDSPTLYCAKCANNFSSKRNFKYHVESKYK